MIQSMTRAAATVALALMAVPATAFGASTTPDEGSPEIRVVNNNAARVRVVLVDADGRHRTLGYVASRNVEIFALDEDAVDGRSVRVKVVIDEPVWSAASSGDAIRTRTLRLDDGSAVQLWVERELTDSFVELRSGAGA
jgi:hypothetical protein